VPRATAHGSSPRARGTPHVCLPLRRRARFIPAGAGNTAAPPPPRSAGTVHPRGRGEHARAAFTASSFSGSSPRARGTRFRGRGHQRGDRFIPAGAGNTARVFGSGTARTVHPRGRGEHVCGQAAGALGRRFIPAGAGNTDWSALMPSQRSVHPRGRGEHSSRGMPTLDSNGSSPRARGTLERQADELGLGRFIPAGAGNTTRRASGSVTSPVHPRGRGEHRRIEFVGSRLAGSSPRARGTQRHALRRERGRRFIPAGAGNTLLLFAAWHRTTVHPRGRGEHRPCPAPRIRSRGSSPRARGTHRRPHRRAAGARFIPAGAGNTPRRWSTPRYPSVHPRGRGEHIRKPITARFILGSSPRARGTRGSSVGDLARLRFIPAGAGNTRALL